MTKTADLGQGWFANANTDGSFTIRNPDKGQRIDLTAESAALFVDIWCMVAGKNVEKTDRLVP